MTHSVGDRGSFRPQAGSIPACVVAIIAASALAGCTVRVQDDAEPQRFVVVSHTWREGFGTNPTTAALVEDRRTGCLYSVAEGRGASAVLTPNGAHAGCQSATGEG